MRKKKKKKKKKIHEYQLQVTAIINCIKNIRYPMFFFFFTIIFGIMRIKIVIPQ